MDENTWGRLGWFGGMQGEFWGGEVVAYTLQPSKLYLSVLIISLLQGRKKHALGASGLKVAIEDGKQAKSRDFVKRRERHAARWVFMHHGMP